MKNSKEKKEKKIPHLNEVEDILIKSYDKERSLDYGHGFYDVIKLFKKNGEVVTLLPLKSVIGTVQCEKLDKVITRKLLQDPNSVWIWTPQGGPESLDWELGEDYVLRVTNFSDLEKSEQCSIKRAFRSQAFRRTKNAW